MGRREHGRDPVEEAVRKQESARLRAEKQLGRLLDASPDCIVVVRAQDGKFIAANSAFARVTGYRVDEIVGRTVAELGIWAVTGERERFLADLRACVTLRERNVLLRTRGGALVPGVMSSSLIEHEGEELIISLMRDLSEREEAERRLRATEKKLASVFEQVPAPVAVSRRDGVFVAVNAAWERVNRVSRDQAIGRAGSALGHWTDPHARARILERVDAAGRVEDELVQFRRSDGSVREVLLSCARIDWDGEPHLLWSSRDVSELRRIEQQALQSERKYRALFETSPEAIATTRMRDGVTLGVNDAWERYTGHRREYAIGRPIAELGLWRDLEDRRAIVARLAAEQSANNVPTRFVRADGATIDVLLSARRIEIEGEDCILWSWRDVSEAKQLERRARQSDAKYAALFNTNPVGLLVTRPSDRVVVEINDAALRMAGVARGEAIGARTGDLVRILNPGEIDALRNRALSGERVSGPLRFERRDGTRVEAVVSGAMVDIDGEPHFVLSVVDITEQRRVERERSEAERKFAALFENSPEPMSLFRVSDGVRLAANAAWERVSGHSRAGAAHRPATQMSLFPDRGQRERLINRVVAAGRVSNVEQRLVRADGSTFDARISGVCLELDGERCILWNWSDISEQRHAEQAQREADARYRALFEAALDGMVITTPQMEILDANPVTFAMSGYAREELIGRPVSMLYSREELAKRPLRRYEADDSWSVLERSLARKDGGGLSVEVLAGPMPDGNVLAIMRDITERKRNETLLMNVARGVSAELGEAFFRSLVMHLARELEADFAFIAELVAPGMEQCRTLAFVADGVIAPNFEYPLAGSPCGSAVERRGTVVYPAGVAELFPADAALARRGIRAYVGTSLHAADGSPLGVLVVMHRKPVARGSFWASMIEIFGARAAAEIERSRAEALVRRTNESLEQVVRERTAQLEEANRDLESYNFSISHDLRQPLNAIAGFAELLREAEINRSVTALEADCVREIEQNAARMEQMIDALLRLSRAGRGSLSRSVIDMNHLADAVVRDLSAAAALPARVTVGELPAARGEPVLVRQVWANLIGNAVKYSRNSAVPRVEISGERSEGFVAYSVRDNGVGFDMRDAPRIFDPFQRLPSGKDFEGSGVGLAIVQRIVRRHGGTVSAESAPGQGATFRFTLPA
jgi:PAS domain S-box-containing protein